MLYEWKELCIKDHMHKWERSAVNMNLVCTTDPEPSRNVDADMAVVIENIEWVQVTLPIKYPTFAELFKDLINESLNQEAAQPTAPGNTGESKAINE